MRPHSAPWLLLVLALAACGGERPPRPGRIILFSMDTVRADRVDGAGQDAPALTAIAAEGVRFERFYAASTYTMPAHMSIFTGLDAAEHGVHSSWARLSPAVSTLAELLSADGYRTLALQEGGYVAARYGFDQGFQEYTELPRLDLVGAGLRRVVATIRRERGQPYFLFLHTYAAHYPYGGWERYRREHPERGLPDDAAIASLRARYRPLAGAQPVPGVPAETRAICTLYNQLADGHGDRLGCGDPFLPPDFPQTAHGAEDLAAIERSYDARIARIDAAIARIRKVLTRLGQWDDTLLIVTSDHGEAFFEHGLYQHGYVPFDEVLRVPLLISYPRLLRHGPVRVVAGLAWQLDLLPTILHLAGAPVPPELEGMDLTPVLLGEAQIPADRGVFPAVLPLAFRDPQPLRRAAIAGRWKFVRGDPHFGDAQGLLFDVAADPSEGHNLRSQRPEDLAAAEARAARWEASLRPVAPLDQRSGKALSQTAPAPADAEKLRELGYVR